MTPDRRTLFTHVGLAALAVGTSSLAGCSRAGASAAAPGAVVLRIPAASVPVGGGVILDAADYVVTQPEAGTFRAFDKRCTHQGCPVSDIAGAEIHCRCHGARFSIADGSVLQGPATTPLRPASATLEGADVAVGG